LSARQNAAKKTPRPPPPPRAWQRMLSGRRLDLLDPSPFDVEITDIAHGLARVARWNGQTVGPFAFSVAQHSVVVEHLCRLIDPRLKPFQLLTALLHDAPEYVIGDMISPFKAALGIDYKQFEDRLACAIHLRFGLTPETDPALHLIIKEADRISAYHEAVQLANFKGTDAKKFFGKPEAKFKLKLEPLKPADAQELYLERFFQLIDKE
jgi:uncharacterized protein